MAAGTILFAFSWVGILFLLAGLGIGAMIVRGFVDLAKWAYEVFVVEPREERLWQERQRQKRQDDRHS